MLSTLFGLFTKKKKNIRKIYISVNFVFVSKTGAANETSLIAKIFGVFTVKKKCFVVCFDRLYFVLI